MAGRVQAPAKITAANRLARIAAGTMCRTKMLDVEIAAAGGLNPTCRA
jgi:hypothetical protein